MKSSNCPYSLSPFSAVVMVEDLVSFIDDKELVRPTEMIHAQIQAHKMLGMHLLKIGKVSEGEKELTQASFLRDSFPTLAKNEPTTYT